MFSVYFVSLLNQKPHVTSTAFKQVIVILNITLMEYLKEPGQRLLDSDTWISCPLSGSFLSVNVPLVIV